MLKLRLQQHCSPVMTFNIKRLCNKRCTFAYLVQHFYKLNNTSFCKSFEYGLPHHPFLVYLPAQY